MFGELCGELSRSEHCFHSTTSKDISMTVDSLGSLVDMEITQNLEKIHKNFYSAYIEIPLYSLPQLITTNCPSYCS
jgi:hypothetical protein